VSLDEAAVFARERGADLVAIDEALTSLAIHDPRKSEIVTLRFFGGLNIEEVAEVLAISRTTVQREWRAAKAWLYHDLSGGTSSD
jgi:RNA polymerase sigma factor (sigma-70 family)